MPWVPHHADRHVARAPPDYLAAMTLRGMLSSWLTARCAICAIERGTPIVCTGCADDCLPWSVARCARCALPVPATTAACGACLRRPPEFDATVAVADYGAPMDGIVLALKFRHRLELAPILGALLAERARSLPEPPALLMPVPLAFERLAERGFNQSLEIARATARDLGAALDHRSLVRVRHAPPQVSLSLDARARNVRGAFVVRGPLHGLRIGVIDDVMTTGSTLNEVARVLKAAGAHQVVNLVVARTP